MKNALTIILFFLLASILQLSAQDLSQNYKKLILNSSSDVSLFQNNSTNGIWASGMIATDRWGVFEDATTAKERFTILSGGNVGIGTSAPAAKLHLIHTKGEGDAPAISGNVATFQTNAAPGYYASINLIGGSSGKSSFYFGDKDSGAMGGLRYNNANNSLTFRTNGSDDRLFIGSNGNVGIGTDAPDSNLQVGESTQGLILIGNKREHAGSAIGTTRSDGGLVLGYNIYANYQDSNDNYMARVSKGHSKGFSGMKFSQHGVIDFFGFQNSVVADDFANTTDNIKMRIDGNGNVGIGTVSPQFMLDIVGDLRFTNSNYMRTKNSSGLTTRIHGINSNNVEYIGAIDQNVSGTIIGTTSDYLNLRTNSISALYIDANQNIGIGTSGPDAKLTVKGKIHTQEVKVDLQGAVMPDYVFTKDYNLRSLKEIEDYIEVNGHLPNIPSAKEAEANGIHLKEMNLKLLEKIEELTLYTINQEKRIELLEAENNDLRAQKERIALLEEKIALLLGTKQ